MPPSISLIYIVKKPASSRSKSRRSLSSAPAAKWRTASSPSPTAPPTTLRLSIFNRSSTQFVTPLFKRSFSPPPSAAAAPVPSRLRRMRRPFASPPPTDTTASRRLLGGGCIVVSSESWVRPRCSFLKRPSGSLFKIDGVDAAAKSQRLPARDCVDGEDVRFELEDPK
jgi:hypothetical protein